MDTSKYNNHYYLYSILSGFFIFVNAHHFLSVDKIIFKLKNEVANWQLLLFKVQFVIVYFYGGIAKLNYDWLRGFPLKFWLYDSSSKFDGLFSVFLKTDFAAYFMSYSGIVFDLFVGFLLLYKPTRKLALIPVLSFHILNHFIWDIGSFPFAMLAATTLFFDANWFDELLKHPVALIKKQFNHKTIKGLFGLNKKRTIPTNVINVSRIHKYIVYVFFFGWLSLQVLFPLRRFVYPGYSSWSGEGHLFAWKMMLVDAGDAIRIKVIVNENDVQDTFYVDQSAYMNDRQINKASKPGRNYLKFVKFIQKELEEKGGIEQPILKLEFYKSVNERSPQLFNDTSLNYAEVDLNYFKHNKWINDWSPQDEPPAFNVETHKYWLDLYKSKVDSTDNYYFRYFNPKRKEK